MDTRLVTAHLPTNLVEKLDKLAVTYNRPRGLLVNEAIAAYIALEEKRHCMTLEALADVDAGRMLEHAGIETEIAAWNKPKRARNRQK